MQQNKTLFKVPLGRLLTIASPAPRRGGSRPARLAPQPTKVHPAWPRPPAPSNIHTPMSKKMFIKSPKSKPIFPSGLRPTALACTHSDISDTLSEGLMKLEQTVDTLTSEMTDLKEELAEARNGLKQVLDTLGRLNGNGHRAPRRRLSLKPKGRHSPSKTGSERSRKATARPSPGTLPHPPVGCPSPASSLPRCWPKPSPMPPKVSPPTAEVPPCRWTS